MAERRDKDDIGIPRVNDDFANRARIFQADVLPGFSGVQRLPDAVALRNVAANAGFAGAHIDDVRIGHRDRDTADRGRSIFVKDRRPGVCAVDGFPYAAAGRSEVVGGGVAGNSRGGQRAASAERANGTILHSLEQRVAFVFFVLVFIVLCRRSGRGGAFLFARPSLRLRSFCWQKVSVAGNRMSKASMTTRTYTFLM